MLRPWLAEEKGRIPDHVQVEVSFLRKALKQHLPLERVDLGQLPLLLRQLLEGGGRGGVAIKEVFGEVLQDWR